MVRAFAVVAITIGLLVSLGCDDGSRPARDFTDDPDFYPDAVAMAMMSVQSAANKIGDVIGMYPDVSSDEEFYFMNSVEILEELETQWTNSKPPVEYAGMHQDFVSALRDLAEGARAAKTGYLEMNVSELNRVADLWARAYPKLQTVDAEIDALLGR